MSIIKRLIKIVDIAIYSVPVAMAIFLAWFTYVQVSVYGHNYYAVIENLDIVIKKPKCAGSFLSEKSLRNKLSYKLYLWLDGNKNLEHAAVKFQGLPDELLSDYFFVGEDSSLLLDKFECDFSKIKEALSYGVGFISFSYAFSIDSLGGQSAVISVDINDNKISDVFGRLRWGL